MTLSELADVGEFIGGIAVLVTLVYLAVQVRQVKIAGRSAAGDETARSWRENLRFIIDHSDLFHRGAYGLDRIQGPEAMRFVAMMQFLFAYIENFYAKYQEGVVDPAEWGRLDEILVFYFSWPGIVEWWSITESQYRPDFAAHVRSLIAELESGERERADLSYYWREPGEA